MSHTATSIADASNAKGETNDCTVRAIAVSTGVDYDIVHDALRARGRRNRRGAYERQWLPAIQDVGFQYEIVTHKFSGRTARTIESELRRRGGRYIVKVARHAIGFDGEKFIDWAAGRLNRVKVVYQIRPAGEVVEPEVIKPFVEDKSGDYIFLLNHTKRNGQQEWRIMIHEHGKDRWLNMKDTEWEARDSAFRAADKRGITFAGHMGARA